MTERFQVGAVSSAHGVRGEVKVYPMTDDPMRYKKLKQVIVQKKNGAEETLAVESARFFKNMVLLKWKGIETRDDAEAYRGSALFVSREEAVPLKENEYFIADLIGLSVFADDGSALGELTDVLQTGANDVYEVTTPGKQKLLIPAIRDCILQVDVEGNRMEVHLLPGLSELNEPDKRKTDER